jgi:phage/plasmid-associated DNA primase
MKIMLVLNQSTDHGMWRRIKVFPFNIKFCKQNIDDFDPNNPYERLADPNLGRDWADDEDVKSAYLSIMIYYYESLMSNYDGIVQNVPHPHIKRETEKHRNSQDHINNFINMKIVKTNEPDSEITLNSLVDSYKKWYESRYPTDKSYTKGLRQEFTNSKLSKIFTKTTNTRKEKIIKGYRILEDNEEPSLDETYFTDLNNKNTSNNPSHNNTQKESAEEFYNRICREYDLQHKKPISEKQLLQEQGFYSESDIVV